MNDRYSKLAFLHRVKERKSPSLSAQASFAPFSLKVAWSGKSLIQAANTSNLFQVMLCGDNKSIDTTEMARARDGWGDNQVLR